MDTISMFTCIGLYSGSALALAGHMSSTPVYDKHSDEAVHTVRVMQMLNPNVSMNSDPVDDVDRRAVTSTMDRHNTQYRAPQSDVNAFTVSVSSGSSPDSVGK